MSVGIYPTGGFEGSRNTTFTKNDLKMMGSQGFDNFTINQDRMDTDALEIMFGDPGKGQIPMWIPTESGVQVEYWEPKEESGGDDDDSSDNDSSDNEEREDYTDH